MQLVMGDKPGAEEGIGGRAKAREHDVEFFAPPTPPESTSGAEIARLNDAFDFWWEVSAPPEDENVAADALGIVGEKEYKADIHRPLLRQAFRKRGIDLDILERDDAGRAAFEALQSMSHAAIVIAEAAFVLGVDCDKSRPMIAVFDEFVSALEELGYRVKDTYGSLADGLKIVFRDGTKVVFPKPGDGVVATPTPPPESREVLKPKIFEAIDARTPVKMIAHMFGVSDRYIYYLKAEREGQKRNRRRVPS